MRNTWPFQRQVFRPPKTQKALNNQGFEYGGSVEIRTQRKALGRAGGLDLRGLQRAIVSVFVPRVFPVRACTSLRKTAPIGVIAVSC